MLRNLFTTTFSNHWTYFVVKILAFLWSQFCCIHGAVNGTVRCKCTTLWDLRFLSQWPSSSWWLLVVMMKSSQFCRKVLLYTVAISLQHDHHYLFQQNSLVWRKFNKVYLIREVFRSEWKYIACLGYVFSSQR